MDSHLYDGLESDQVIQATHEMKHMGYYCHPYRKREIAAVMKYVDNIGQISQGLISSAQSECWIAILKVIIVSLGRLTNA